MQQDRLSHKQHFRGAGSRARRKTRPACNLTRVLRPSRSSHSQRQGTRVSPRIISENYPRITPTLVAGMRCTISDKPRWNERGMPVIWALTLDQVLWQTPVAGGKLALWWQAPYEFNTQQGKMTNSGRALGAFARSSGRVRSRSLPSFSSFSSLHVGLQQALSLP